jgi:hypothetical protein
MSFLEYNVASTPTGWRKILLPELGAGAFAGGGGLSSAS